MILNFVILLGLTIVTCAEKGPFQMCVYDAYSKNMPDKIPLDLCTHVGYIGRNDEKLSAVLALKKSRKDLKILWYALVDTEDNPAMVWKEFIRKFSNDTDGIIYDTDDYTPTKVTNDVKLLCGYIKSMGKECYIQSEHSNIPIDSFKRDIKPLTDGVIMEYSQREPIQILKLPTIHPTQGEFYPSLEESIQFWLKRGYRKDEMIGSISLWLERLCTLKNQTKTNVPQFGDECRYIQRVLPKQLCEDQTMTWAVDEKEFNKYGYNETHFVSLFTPTSAEAKTRYMAEQGLAGFAFHSLHVDEYNSTYCYGDTFPILRGAVRGFLGTSEIK